MTSTHISIAKDRFVRCLLGAGLLAAWPLACASDGQHIVVDDSQGGEAGAGNPLDAGGSSSGGKAMQPSAAGDAPGGQASAGTNNGGKAGSETRGGSTGGGDGGSSGAGGESSVGCDPSPRVVVGLTTDVLLIPGLPTSLERINISSNFCETIVTYSTHSMFLTYAHKGIAFFLRANHSTSWPGLSVQYQIDHDTPYPDSGAESLWVEMIPSALDLASFDPDWASGTHAAILVETKQADGSQGACLDRSGITYTVKGHAEAVVSYDDGHGYYGLTKGTKTSTNPGGQAAVFIETTGTLAEPEFVEVTGSKAGCTVRATGYLWGGQTSAQTGFVPVAGGVVSGVVHPALEN